MKKFYLFLIGFMLCGVINAQDAPPAGTPVISLTTTTAGATVRMRMQAAVANTPVWIETAPNTYTPVTVGTGLTDFTNYTNYTPTGTSLKVYGNLIEFECNGESNGRNPVSTLDASGNTNLQALRCSYNQLTSLDVQGLTQLNYLSCSNNQLTSLNVQGLTQLQKLYCYNNQLQSLDVQGLTQLQKLWCYNNQLISLNVQGLTKLEILYCYNNRLTSLDVQGLTQLIELRCHTNQLISLDVQGLRQLKNLECYNNQLQSLDVPGLGLTELNNLECYNNPCTSTTLGLDQLYCQLPQRKPDDNARILVSEKAEVEAFVLATNGVNANSKNWKVFSSGSFYEITNTTGAYVCVSTPPVIELTTTTAGATVRMRMKAPVANTPVWIETAPNTYTPVTVGTDWTSSKNYTPTGTSLKVYGNLIAFNCSGADAASKNPISALDASGNTNLIYLGCSYNELTSLDVQGLTQLKYLYCSNNQLQSLDVQGLTQLQKLYCDYNRLQSLDVQGLTQLNHLSCYYNRLQSLDVQGLTQLQGLECSINQLTSLNVQGLTQLQTLKCSSNQLQSLNVQGLTQLNHLSCYYNQLQSLDVQGLTQLNHLSCYNNPCTSSTLGLDLFYCQLPQRKPDDNAKIYISTKQHLEAFVLATNRTIANSKNWKLFSTYGYDYEINHTTGTYMCGSTPSAGTPVIELTTTTAGASVRMRMQAAAANTPVLIETAPNTFTLVTVGTRWTDFTNYTPTGTSLKVYGNLIGFDCSGESTINQNPISALDASGNTNLQLLRCHTNQLISLDVQGLTQLDYLYCYNNQLQSLDVQGLTQLKNLQCYNNPCTSTTLGLDQLYCQLPQRQASDGARIYVSEQAQANVENFVLATNRANANSKNWNLYGYDEAAKIPTNIHYGIINTTGNYVCGTGIEAVKSTVSIYPNPASNNITVETEAFGSTITITDLLGRTVMTATATATKTTLNISSLTAGTYVVRVGDRIAKVVKM